MVGETRPALRRGYTFTHFIRGAGNRLACAAAQAVAEAPGRGGVAPLGQERSSCLAREGERRELTYLGEFSYTNASANCVTN